MSSKLPALPTGRRLLRRTWADYRAHGRLYVLIVAVVAVPVCLAGALLGAGDSSGVVSTLSVVATLLMTLSLVYTIVLSRRDGVDVRLRAAYYDGSAYFVKYFLISMVLLIMALPALIGLDLAALANYDPSMGGLALNISDRLLVTGIGLALCLPSAWMLTRFGWALPVSVWESLWPMAALRRGRALTLKRFWKILGRLVFVGALSFIALIIIFIPIIFIGKIWPDGALNVYSLLCDLIILPPVVLYLVNLYRVLAGDELS